MTTATSFAKSALSAFRQDKPHSSITDWVDILTGQGYADDAYDGIPELVDSINIQSTGPAEVARAVRKKIKHGNPHQQYRALVILNALVENGDAKLKTTLFADGYLTDVLRNMGNDSSVDQKVKRKLIRILAAWHAQYKDDPSMKTAASLHKQHKNDTNNTWRPDAQMPKDEESEAARRKSKEEARRKAKEEAERLKREEKKKRENAGKPKIKRKPFNFEEERPKILTQIASATQSANNLVNAITLVNRESETLQENARVQECLVAVKQERKPIVRYIQLVENEDMIGTLIETNERIITALEMYDMALSSKPAEAEGDVEKVQKALAATKIEDLELIKLQEKQRAAVDRAIRTGSVRERGEAHVHPDLEGLNFGELGEESGLPPPLRPSAHRTSSDEDLGRGSLSEYSDYESSDEEVHNQNTRNVASSSDNYSGRHTYPGASDLDVTTKKGLLEDDPFADPFGDSHGVDDSSTILDNGKQKVW
ncbi:hypothetical protein BDM02DRAFT_1466312 [Thelephora ganbajun]|uniref:Uncharacterized protein n=1 Tax=Thelephora ganbajun TaxID=370292 RepID=A0ACB6Z243_THEGA|nr:hypothetical protein BDM02DRAFT_1466312 [Thelephora ganbajun]